MDLHVAFVRQTWLQGLRIWTVQAEHGAQPDHHREFSIGILGSISNSLRDKNDWIKETPQAGVTPG
jgi:hypothetical protein